MVRGPTVALSTLIDNLLLSTTRLPSECAEMSTAFLGHGVTADRRGFALRNCIDVRTAVAFLKDRERPLGRLDRLTADGGEEALTVDDSTMAGAQFCRLARSFGHEVTFFINPMNVETRTPHWFVVLDSAIDATSRSRAVFRRETFSLHGREERKAFRRFVKTVMRACGTDDEIGDVLRETLSALDMPDPDVPVELLPPPVDELRDLLHVGVMIESHGWSHLEVSSLTEDAFRRQIDRSRHWLRDVLGIESRSYAVPFGETIVPPHLRETIETYLLAAPGQTPGWVAPSILNRADIPPSRA
jgi:hypothetical protein